MSKSNLIEKREKKKNDFGDEVKTVIYRFPKKDHNKMVEFTNIAKTISANLEEEEVWREIIHYNDKKHKDEVMEKMKNDTSCEQGFQEFMKLVTPESSVIIGDFSVKDIEFIR